MSWRRSPLDGRPVVVAPGRARRPGGIAGEPRPGADECPFCAGQEGRTPPETFACRPAGGPPDGPGWSVRAVPNLYPAFPGQEVVIHGPDHVTTFAALADETVAAVADAWRERERAHRAAGAAYLLVAVNEGARAGASLEHSHSQLVPFDHVPPVPAAERTAAGSCALCAALPDEHARVVAEADGIVTLVPSWGRGPYELLVAPLEHRGDALAAAAEPIAAALRGAARRLRAVAGPDLAWNAWLHADPLSGAGGRHWHVELLPRLTVFAGVELGAGVSVNPVDPDRAADELRAARDRG